MALTSIIQCITLSGKRNLETDLFSRFAVFGYGYQILLKRTHFTNLWTTFTFLFLSIDIVWICQLSQSKTYSAPRKKFHHLFVFICLLFLSRGWRHQWRPMELMLLFFRVHPLLICLA